MITITRYHDISAGHRVVGHEGACSNLHGHNYRIWFTCTSDSLDDVGRVIDFSEVKKRLCAWLDDNWDHRFLVWEEDPWAEPLALIDRKVVWVPFNPTAEKLAAYLVEHVGPKELKGTGVVLVACQVDETRKCSAQYSMSAYDFSTFALLKEQKQQKELF